MGEREKARLSREGYDLRERLAEAGVEVTPDQLAEAVEEARGRVRPGPEGVCTSCGKGPDDPRPDGGPRDFRYGLCCVCAFPPQPATPDTEER